MNWGLHEKCGIWDQNALFCIAKEHLAAQTLPLSLLGCSKPLSPAETMILWIKAPGSKTRKYPYLSTASCPPWSLSTATPLSCQINYLWDHTVNCIREPGQLKKPNIWCWQWFSNLEQLSDWVHSTASTGRGSTWTFIAGIAANSLNWNHCCLIVKSPCKEVFYSPGSLLLNSPASNC